jgi:hypothetical protein
MAAFPLKVRRRDKSGAVVEVLCGTSQSALDNAHLFRGLGYKDVWIEDANGHLIFESALDAKRA